MMSHKQKIDFLFVSNISRQQEKAMKATFFFLLLALKYIYHQKKLNTWCRML